MTADPVTVDLTCETCRGEGSVPVAYAGRTWIRCLDCDATGRRRPTLAEWDALVAATKSRRDAEVDAAVWASLDYEAPQ